MAVDSREKRAGAILGMPWMVITPVADGTIDGSDRQMLANVYPGVTPAAPAADTSEVMFGMMRIIRMVRCKLMPYSSMYIE